MTCAILTNGTDTITDEIARSDLSVHFDAVFNSADIGYVKPDIRAFSHVADALHIPASEYFFTDDSPSKLTGAEELGMLTHAFVGIRELRAALRRAGVIIDAAHETRVSQERPKVAP